GGGAAITVTRPANSCRSRPVIVISTGQRTDDGEDLFVPPSSVFCRPPVEPHADEHFLRHGIILHEPRAVAQPARFALNHEVPQQRSGLAEQRLALAAPAQSRRGRIEHPQGVERGREPPPEPAEASGLLTRTLQYRARAALTCGPRR